MRQPHWKNYRNAETVQFFKYLLQITNTYNLTSLSLSVEVNLLLPLYTELENAFKASGKSKYTQALVLVDEKRNRTLRALNKAIDCNLLHFNPDKISASQRIEKVFKRYGPHIQELNYSSKSAVIRNLCRGLQTDKQLRQDVKFLGIEDLLEHLQEQNHAFQNIFLLRIKGMGSKGAFEETKTKLIAHYRTFIKTLEARAYLDDTESYEPLKQDINRLVIKFQRETKQGVTIKKEEVVETVPENKLVVIHTRNTENLVEPNREKEKRKETRLSRKWLLSEKFP